MPAPTDLAERVTLAQHTTIRVGGPAAAWVRTSSDAEVVEAVRACDQTATPVLLLGDGSNLVVADTGFPGTVVEIDVRGVTTAERGDVVLLTASAGEPWDDLAARTVAEGWSGIEALSGIPGRTGATPVQNVGAYGQDIASVLSSVEAYDRVHDEIVTMGHSACDFGYRSSVFKQNPNRWVVLSLTLRLSASSLGTVRYLELAEALGVGVGDAAPVAEIRAAVLALRRAKGMVLDPADHDTWSAGSFFTNPIVESADAAPADCPRHPAAAGVKLSAAWLIEHAGIPRGYRLDGHARAAISSKHTLALCNRGGATAADIMALARDVQRRVADASGIDLTIEPMLVADPG